MRSGTRTGNATCALAVLAEITTHAGVTAPSAVQRVGGNVGTLFVTEVGVGRSTTAAYSLDAGVGVRALHIASAAVERVGLEVSACDAAYVRRGRSSADWFR
jgi:hypothetical protein